MQNDTRNVATNVHPAVIHVRIQTATRTSVAVKETDAPTVAANAYVSPAVTQAVVGAAKNTKTPTPPGCKDSPGCT